MKYLLLFLSCCCVAAAADERGAVIGRWGSENSIIEIAESGGQLHATVIALLDPVYREGQAGQAGTVRVDSNNPNEALRSRTIIGIDLLEAYAYEDGKWHGRIYDPESGNTYKSQMSVDGDGNLRMRGYVGVPMLGRTVIFKPVSSCAQNIPKMLAATTFANTCSAS